MERMTYGEVMAEISEVLKSPYPQTAADALLKKIDNPFARANIGYLAGYYSPENAQRIYRLFRTSHPIFGTSSATPEEALAAGMKIGEQMKEKIP